MRPQPGEAARYPAQSAMASDIVAVWASFIATGVPVVGNTTLPRVTSQNLASSELPYVELVQPGVQAQGNWSVGELFAFWDGLPLLENQKPPSPAPAADGQVDPRRSERSSATNSWQHLHPSLLSAVQLICLRLLLQ